MITLWFLLQAAIVTAAALVAGRGRPRRAATALLLSAGLLLPWFAPLGAAALVFLSFFAVIGVLKATQISSAAGAWPAWRRLWHLYGVIDVRRACRVPRAVDARALAIAAACAALSAASILGLIRLQGAEPGWYLAGRTLCAAVLTPAFFAAIANLTRFAYLALGIDAPPLQRAPVLSRSLGEFWRKRWNTVVGDWLHAFVFLPLARRIGPTLALAAAFAVSAALHAWIALGLGATAMMMMGGYFLWQGAAVLLEIRLGVRRSGAWAGRLWTATVLIAPLSLLSEPFMQALGV